MLKGKKIVLGITGSIAAYKACLIIRTLVKKGAEVQVVITPSGKEFITPVTLSALTQKPVVSVVTGLIKGNVPSRIAFKVAANGDSRTILDRGGAEKLLGNGDMLFYMNGAPNLKRVQGAWVTDEEVLRVTNFIRSQGPPQYNDEVISQQVQPGAMGGVVMSGGSSSTDETFETAVKLVIEARKASTSYLQRRLGIGYGRAAKLIDEMEDRGIVGPPNGSKPRQVLVSSYEEIGE